MTEKKYTIEFTEEDLEYLDNIIEMAWSQGYPPLTSIYEQLEDIKKEAFA